MPKKGERTVRVQNLIEHYYDDWNEGGLSPLQIAEKYNVSNYTLYKNLQEIADAHGVAREVLLKAPEHSGERESYENPMKKEKADLEKLKADLQSLKEAILKVMETNERLIKEVSQDDKT